VATHIENGQSGTQQPPPPPLVLLLLLMLVGQTTLGKYSCPEPVEWVFSTPSEFGDASGTAMHISTHVRK
jgi:hypothetical protein